MKILHILKSEPDDNTRILIDILSQNNEPRLLPLYEGEPDYEKMIDLIFEYDQTVSWW